MTQRDDTVTVRQARKNNLLFLLTRVRTPRGDRCLLSVLAFSTFADGWKLQDAIGGIDEDTATALFEDALAKLKAFSWETDGYVLED